MYSTATQIDTCIATKPTSSGTSFISQSEEPLPHSAGIGAEKLISYSVCTDLATRTIE